MDRRAIFQACRTLTKPVASLMLKCGMTWREFADISKGVFVEVATKDYGIRGRPTNVSRVSILTGIGRKEVKRQRELVAQADAEALPSKTTDATRVLSGWHQDPVFADEDGQPRVLPLDGPAPSFEALCDQYAGDVAASAMHKELKRAGAVGETAAGLRALQRYYMPARVDAQWLINAGSVMRDLGMNINHNLVADEDHPSHFMGRASNDGIPESALPAFRDFIEAEGQAFLERVDDWLTEHQSEKGPRRTRTARLGVGLFLIRDAGRDDDQE